MLKQGSQPQNLVALRRLVSVPTSQCQATGEAPGERELFSFDSSLFVSAVSDIFDGCLNATGGNDVSEGHSESRWMRQTSGSNIGPLKLHVRSGAASLVCF